jgi:hypothetical protein
MGGFSDQVLQVGRAILPRAAAEQVSGLLLSYLVADTH